MTDSSGQPTDAAPTAAEPDVSAAPDQPQPQAGADSTVGTGSVLGIGCTILVILFICVAGVIFLIREAT